MAAVFVFCRVCWNLTIECKISQNFSSSVPQSRCRYHGDYNCYYRKSSKVLLVKMVCSSNRMINLMVMVSMNAMLVILSAVVSTSAFVPQTSFNNKMRSLSSNCDIPASKSTTARFFFDFLKQDDQKPEDKKEEEETVSKTSDDPVDKIFGFFFGQKEEEPMGMKRFGRERFPEQYPAVLDEWAEPVASDNSEMAVLRPMLKNTNLEFRGLKLTYSANRDGWNADSFHRKVDKLGGALVVCTTKNGLVCGGYNPKGWVGYGEARGSIAAFLFVYENGIKDLPTKLRKVGGPSLAQQDLPESGPSFGADSLVIPLGKQNSKIARSKLGSYYERFPDGTNTLFGSLGASAQLKDLKVYHGIYEEGEYIPFTDAEPFALY